MTPITLHIEYLLQRNDCLILPGLGALIAHAVPASFDMQKGVVTPPSREISFNPAIRHDDGTLATSIARREQVKFEEGRIMMQQAIADIISALRIEGEFNIGRIGMLTLVDDSEIRFISFASHRRAGSELGMASLAIRDLTAEADSAATEETCARDSQSAQSAEAASSAASAAISATSGLTVSTASGEEYGADSGAKTTAESQSLPKARPGYTWRALSDKNYYVAINKIFAKCAASVAAVFVVAFILLSPVINPAHEQVTASMNPMESIAVSKKTTHNIPLREDVTESGEPTHAPKADSSAPIAVEETSSTSYLIVATFSSQKEAEAFVEARSGGSYELQAIKGRNVWRVAAGHGDQASLRALLNSDEFRAAFSEAWIWSSSR